MQKVLTTNPDSSAGCRRQKFLALTALDENPKELMAAESEIQKELRSNPEYVPALMAQAALDTQRGQTKPATEMYSNILRRLPDFAPAQKRLAMLYAQDPSTVAAAYDLATKARKTLPDDPELAELLGRLSYEKRNIRAPSSCYRKALGNGRSTPILFLSGNVSAPSQTKGRSARSRLIKLWSPAFRNLFATEANTPSRSFQHE